MNVRRIVVVLVMLMFAGSVATADDEKRLRRALDWPPVDLSAYDTVFVEDCRITDPKAGERKIQELVETAPRRMADYLAFSIDREAFPQVERGTANDGAAGLIVRVELTQYKPGSAAARAMLAGTGSAHLDLAVQLIDAASGEAFHSFTESRNFSWGGAYGGSRGITLMEEKAAVELAAYLSLSKGLDRDTVLARIKAADVQPAPTDREYGTIHILRPQGFVGAAVRFRIGVDDVTLGESKRNRYHTAYVSPGEHRVWWGNDKKQKFKPLTVEAGQIYYYEAMGMKPLPAAKGEKKLAQCTLVRALDLTVD